MKQKQNTSLIYLLRGIVFSQQDVDASQLRPLSSGAAIGMFVIWAHLFQKTFIK